MKTMFLFTILVSLASCDTIRYRKGEMGEKEQAINEKSMELLKCFSGSKAVPEFSFVVVRPKVNFSSGIKRFGVLGDPKTISSSEGGDNACLESNLRGLQVPIVSLVDFEKVRFRWDQRKWNFIPDDAYL